jgi:hypothetical protein
MGARAGRGGGGMSDEVRGRVIRAVGLALYVAFVAFFFANVEIQIEGAQGWAAGLPVTFRIEKHWLLDIFWGGRPMTGYHAWVFSFMFLMFHVPFAWTSKWTVRLEARAIACVSGFWIVEDFLWFILNPAYGWAKLTPAQVPWHIHWFMGFPTDYWTFTIVGTAIYAWSWWQEDPK